jgi:patatin-like phospholipase/acyl hydrolase
MENPFRILAIDGGGIRGVIPAKILDAIEKHTGCPTFELFDLVAGTSTGGIIALGLTKPHPNILDKPQAHYTAADLVELYETCGEQIFRKPSPLRKLGLFFNEAKFPSEGRDSILNKYFGNTYLKAALKEILITSYDIERRIPVLFTSILEKQNTNSQVPQRLCDGVMMKQAAMATSAAPTYFEPYQISVENLNELYTLVDGGLFANNPSSLATTEVIYNFVSKTRGKYKLDMNEVLVVSLGTGSLQRSYSFQQTKRWGMLQWVRPVIDISMDGNSASIDNQMRQLFTQTTDGVRHYYRLNPILNEKNEAMDDASKSNMSSLSQLADETIAKSQADLDQLCEILLKHKSPWRGSEFV